jgi:hypothetical protein
MTRELWRDAWDDAGHPDAGTVFDIADPFATDEFDAILEATGHADWLPRTVTEFVQAIDLPETEHGQHHHEVQWHPELVYDDRGWPPGIGVFYD